jgi:hypothetical protein
LIYEIASVVSLPRNDVATQPLTGEGWGEGEKSINFAKLFIPLAFIPCRQGRGKITFYESIKSYSGSFYDAPK